MHFEALVEYTFLYEAKLDILEHDHSVSVKLMVISRGLTGEGGSRVLIFPRSKDR